jgi:hypothetical protein
MRDVRGWMELAHLTWLDWSSRRVLAAQTRADLRWHREKANA